MGGEYRMKKIIIGFIVGALMFSIIPVMAQEGLTVVPNPFPVVIDGVVTEVEGYNINGYTFLKLADFGKAGLTVKFNETDKQIEISSTKKAVITPEPIPDKGDDVVSDKQVYEENGYKVIMDNEVEYYSWKSICDNIEPKGYNIGYDKTGDSMFLIKYNTIKKSTADSTKILESIPYKIFNDATHIPKDYYLNKILPLIK
jgi:hypothetical protein